MDKILSIFCDESGDVGPYSEHSPYYLVSLVFHDQSNDLSKKIEKLDNAIKNYGYENQLIHTGPLIRRERPYKDLLPDERKTLFTKLYYFMLKSNVQYKTFIYNKLNFNNLYKLESQIAKDISSFIFSNSSFKKFNKQILYYDYGQQSITRTMNIVMSMCFDNHETRKINPNDYKLFQVADLVCTLELINKKIQTNNLTKSEQYIFHSKSDFKKDFYKKYSRNIMS